MLIACVSLFEYGTLLYVTLPTASPPHQCGLEDGTVNASGAHPQWLGLLLTPQSTCYFVCLALPPPLSKHLTSLIGFLIDRLIDCLVT